MTQGVPDLQSAIASIDLAAARAVDWPRVRRSVYVVHQHLTYTYPGPIRQLQQRLVIVPPAQHGDQRLVDHRLTVTNPAEQTRYRADAFGNTEIISAIPVVEHTIAFEAWILVERQADAGPHYVPAHQLGDERYHKPSRLTQPDGALSEAAASLRESGQTGIELAHEINRWVYRRMHYAHGVTGIHTSAAEALGLGRGVCQDYAHIMVALCRLCGLAARYVSGHLLGEGGTHAWVEVILPVADHPEHALVAPLDPTRGRAAGMDYVTVAVGSDYFDVAPTSGSYFAAYGGHLSARKRVGLTMVEYA